MKLDEDQDLFWIADQALQQPEDPEGWIQQESPNGDMYYVHEVTEMVLWQHPLDYHYQQAHAAAPHARPRPFPPPRPLPPSPTP